MPDEERTLRRFLSQAHDTLDPATPGFEMTLAAARRHGRPARRRWPLAAAAAILILGAGISAGIVGHRRAATLDPAEALRLAESLSAWQAPTDFLRRPPGADLLETLPHLTPTNLATLPRTTAEALSADPKEEHRDP